MKRVLILCAALLLLPACSTQSQTQSSAAQSVTLPQNPQQAVYLLKQSLLAALTVAEDYQKLPICGPGRIICRSVSVEQRIALLAQTAVDALDEAERVVRAASAGDDSRIVVAKASAVAALNALVSLTNTLKVR